MRLRTGLPDHPERGEADEEGPAHVRRHKLAEVGKDDRDAAADLVVLFAGVWCWVSSRRTVSRSCDLFQGLHLLKGLRALQARAVRVHL